MDTDESSSCPGRIKDVLEVVKDCHPICSTVISKTPESEFVDWKLYTEIIFQRGYLKKIIPYFS
jgi:hypothetical protein